MEPVTAHESRSPHDSLIAWGATSWTHLRSLPVAELQRLTTISDWGKMMKVNSSHFKALVLLHLFPIISCLLWGVLPCPTYILPMFHTFSPSASPSRILIPGLRPQHSIATKNSMNRNDCSPGLSTATQLWPLRSKLDECWSESACHKFHDQGAQSHQCVYVILAVGTTKSDK